MKEKPEFVDSTALDNVSARNLPDGGADAPEEPVKKKRVRKVRAATQQQQDQLADVFATLGAPIPDDVPGAEELKKAQPEMTNPEVPEAAVHTDSEFAGFTVPDGDDRLMFILHPQKGEDGKMGEPPQLLARVNHQDWVSWVREAVTYGLTKGSVVDAEGDAMTGLSATFLDKDGEPHQYALLFTQIAAVVPFRDIDTRLAKAQARKAAAQAAEQRKKDNRRKANKAAAKARRRNR